MSRRKFFDPISQVPQCVIQLMEFTGLDRISAENLLEIADWSLQRAINYHLENINESGGLLDPNLACSNEFSGPVPADIVEAALPRPAVVPLVEDSDDDVEIVEVVRPPIPARREQLILPGGDLFLRPKRGRFRPRLWPFQDFLRETDRQERQLNSYLSGGGESSTGGGSSSTGGGLPGSMVNFLPTHKRVGLEDLFRPPVEILFCGTFRAARDHATAQNRWLIVNLQDNAEFRSQVINRDIWSDRNLRTLIQKHFVLWQISVDNPDGLRFKTFYKVKSMPYICIIDPRTGEEKQILDAVTSQIFTTDLDEYLNSNGYTLEMRGEGSSSSGHTRSQPTCTITKPSNASEGSADNASKAAIKPAELSEEDQLAIAIKNSLNDAGTKQQSDEDSDDPIYGDINYSSTSEDEPKPYEKLFGSDSDPTTMIRLRHPCGMRVLMKWPSTTPLRAIKLFVQMRFPKLTKRPYKLISAYPRVNILELDEWTTLAEAKLHPNVILYLHIDN